ncbi:flagellar brake protein [Lacimicrobium sp. SS2-24]|uniref:flagellar brake domain-containing protein n=1 Tax=Lacimicrobium sp. SS2-24 TaxID=2005569 RepID=UPI000B4A7F15|nr:flagellar brake protein [Lacimicrobium sp. SS2-24]
MAILSEKSGLSTSDLRKLRSLRPGMSLDVQVKSPTAAKRVRTEFVGMDGTRCIILRYPDESKWGSLKDAIYADNSLIVRFILEDETGEVIAFKSNIILVATRPVPLIFLSFPTAIQNQGLRSEKRTSTRTPVQLATIETDKPFLKAMILDISSKGCRIGIKKEQLGNLKLVGKQLMLKIPGNNDTEYAVKGKVVNNKSDDVSTFYGIQFVEGENDPDKLNTLLAEISIEF